MSKQHIITIDSIFADLQTYALAHPHAFDITFGESPGDITVLTTEDFINELKIAYRQMSFTCYDDSYLSGFLQNWGLYKKRHYDEWQIIWNYLQGSSDLDPSADKHEYEVATPDLTSETTYGKVSTNGGTITSALAHGKVTTNQTNTYDGALRDSAKSTDSGTDTTTNTLADTNTLSGKDSTTTSGTNTVEKTSYSHSPFDNLNKAIMFYNTYNLRDLIIDNFTKEFMFYDNGNEEVMRYGFYY